MDPAPTSAPEPAAPVSPALSGGKLWLFRLVSLACAAAAGFVALEWFLQSRQTRIGRSDTLEPGLIQYDANLGWRLQSNWRGEHRHGDFLARYSTHRLGFRGDTAFPQRDPARPLTAVVGDSFTFGFGVNDDATFVHLLDAAAPGGATFANFAVPGFSTDQEALLIEREVTQIQPRRILLVVYVGNDLLDNPRPSPLQVRSPKPYFEWQDDKLQLRNTPVPPPPAPPAESLASAILGPDRATWPWRVRLEQQSEIFRVLSQSAGGHDFSADVASRRLQPTVVLFGRLLERIRRTTEQRHIELVVAVLAGRSHALHPRTLSGRYQEYFRTEVLRLAKEAEIPAVDIADHLRKNADDAKEPWFYLNDGHLTPAGHKVVAEFLARNLPR